jgi:hypothetical protein
MGGAYLEVGLEVMRLRLAEDHEHLHARHEILGLLEALDVGTDVEDQRGSVRFHRLSVCRFDELRCTCTHAIT